MSIVKDENSASGALAIVQKYESFVHYIYPILQNCPRKHGVLRDTVLAALFLPIGDLRRLQAFLAAWIGHARWADSANLLRSLEIGGDHP